MVQLEDKGKNLNVTIKNLQISFAVNSRVFPTRSESMHAHNTGRLKKSGLCTDVLGGPKKQATIDLSISLKL